MSWKEGERVMLKGKKLIVIVTQIAKSNNKMQQQTTMNEYYSLITSHLTTKCFLSKFNLCAA